MKILLSVIGTWGDVSPMLGLAQYLRSQGHSITFITTSDFEEVFKNTEVLFKPMPYSLKQNTNSIIKKSIGPALHSPREIRQMLVASQEVLHNLIPEQNLVLSAGMDFASFSAAEKAGVNYRYITFCPVWVPSTAHLPPLFKNQTRVRVLNHLAWDVFQKGAEVLMGPFLSRQRNILGLPPLKHPYQQIMKKTVLSMNPAFFQKESEMKDLPLIPYFPTQFKRELPENVDKFSSGVKGCIYIGFGSMPVSPRVSDILIRISQWLDCNILVGLPAMDTAPQKNFIPENVLLTGELDHRILFPKMKLAVHHGGAGTVHTASLSGIPQVIVPHVLDQYYWARRIESLGLGINCGGIKSLSLSGLLRAIQKVLDNPHYQQTAHSFSSKMSQTSIDKDTWNQLTGIC